MTLHPVRRPVAALVAVALVALYPAPAVASVRANVKQQRALAKAIHTSPVGGLNTVPRRLYQISGQRISSISHSWAIAQLVARRSDRGTFQSSYVIAVQPAGTRSWVVVSLGSAQVGCGIAPDVVLADLTGAHSPAEVCPPGEGIA